MPYILIISGFVFLIKGADLLVNGGVALARRFGVSDLVIGLTVIAFGTSMPELFVNVVAGIQGSVDIAVGNVIGSNIANILLILGVSSIIFPLAVPGGTVSKEIPLSLLAAIVLWILANDHLIDKAPVSVLTRTDGMVFLCFFLIFLYYSFSVAGNIAGMDNHVPAASRGGWSSGMLILLGIIGLSIGGQFIVSGAVSISNRLGISQSVIGLTVVAVGTSLPELATSAVAAFKKNAEISVGNVIGSNIFNVFFVLGVSAMIRPLPIQQSANRDIGMVVLSSMLLLLFMFTGKRRSLDRWEGALFLALYAVYTVYIVVAG